VSEPAPKTRGRATGLWLRLALSVAVLAALLSIVPLGDLWEAARRVSPLLWLGCVAAFIAGHAVGAFKWSLLIGVGGSPLGYPTVLRFHFAGLFANLFLPSVAGGDIVRAGLALRSADSRAAVVVGSVIDRLIDTSALALLLLGGALASRASLAPGDATLLLAFVGLMVAGGLAGLAMLFVPLPARVPVKLRDARRKVREALLLLARRPGRALVAFALALLMQGSFVGLNAVLGRACGIELPFAVWLFAWPLAKIAAMLPVSLAGIGVREAALAGVLSRFDVPGAQAVAVGLLWETVLIAGGAFGGLFYTVVRRRAVPQP
jgi:uncharacterized membrane protein YbhN (UPF0104 family)